MARILVIDDQDDVRDVVMDILKENGHSVDGVGDGRTGLRLIATEKFDLVITDIIMPRKQGFDLIVEIRAKYPGLKIVAMSGGGQGDPSDYLRIATQLGADMVLAKPFGPAVLGAAVARILQEPARVCSGAQ